MDEQPARVIDLPAPGEGRTAPGSPERWAVLMPHRPGLLRLARRRGSGADAEDCVSEALLRALLHDGLESGTAGAFLRTTVANLVVDEHRRSVRVRRAGVREHAARPAAAAFEDRVCDRAEAQWLAERLGGLRGRERELAAARMRGVSVAQFAEARGIPPGAAENAWTRVRHKGLRALAGCLSALAGIGALLRRPVLAAPAAVLAVAVAVSTAAAPGADLAPPAAADGYQHADPQRPAATLPGAAAARRVPSAPRALSPAANSRPTAAAAAAAAARAKPPLVQVDDPRPHPAVVVGGTRVEKRNEDESFLDSALRCAGNVDVNDPLADPCDY